MHPPTAAGFGGSIPKEPEAFTARAFDPVVSRDAPISLSETHHSPRMRSVPSGLDEAARPVAPGTTNTERIMANTDALVNSRSHNTLFLLGVLNSGEQGRTIYWRKGWDSNPRYPCRHAGFQDRCLKPLGHPSVTRRWLAIHERQGAEKAVCHRLGYPRRGAPVYGSGCRFVNANASSEIPATGYGVIADIPDQ
jgi:hypothetical protein